MDRIVCHALRLSCRDGPARAQDYGQAIVADALAVEPPANVKSAANGKPAAGQLCGTRIEPAAACARGRRLIPPTVSERETNEASGS